MQDSRISARLAELAPSGRNCLCIPISSPRSLRIAASPARVARSLSSLMVRAAGALPAWTGGAAPSRPSRSAVRRSAGRQTRGPAWIFAVAMSMLRTIGKGAKS